MSRTRKRPHYSQGSSPIRYGTMSTIRAGKWTTEEESLASRLIYEFEIGALNDCEEGATLRSYLARKLNCQPMRISKKFAGQCIGKHIYSGRSTSCSRNHSAATPKPTKKARPTLPSRTSTRFRQTPDSYSDSSMIYNYHDSSSSATTSDAEDNDDDDEMNEREDGAFSPKTTQDLDFGKRLRVVGDPAKRTTKTAYLFTPIRPQPISPNGLTSSSANSSVYKDEENEDGVLPPKMVVENLDIDHVLHGNFGATTGEPEEWRDVLMDLFGRADSESPTHEDEIFYNNEGEYDHLSTPQPAAAAAGASSSSSYSSSSCVTPVAGRKQPLPAQPSKAVVFRTPVLKRGASSSTLKGRKL